MLLDSTAVLFATAIMVGSGMVSRPRRRRTPGVLSPVHFFAALAGAVVVIVQRVSGYVFDFDGSTIAMALAVVAVLSFVVTRFIRDNVDTEHGDEPTEQ